MSNAVADKYRGCNYFDSESEKNKAIAELTEEEGDLQTEIDAWEHAYNNYQDDVLPKLTLANDDFEGFVTNKMKNAQIYLNEGYNGDKLDDLNAEMDEYLEELTSCNEDIQAFIEDINIRQRDISLKKRRLEDDLIDLRSVLDAVRSAAILYHNGY